MTMLETLAGSDQSDSLSAHCPGLDPRQCGGGPLKIGGLQISQIDNNVNIQKNNFTNEYLKS